MERFIGLDIGDRRIGIAVSDPLQITAQPLETYVRKGYGPDVAHIREIASHYDVKRIVCGLPKNMDGTEGFQSEKAKAFAAELEKAGFTILFQDERMTTIIAESALLEGNVSRNDRKGKVDMVAAAVILQSFLDAGTFRIQDDAEDAEEDDGTVSVTDEEGNTYDLYPVAEVTLHGRRYSLMNMLGEAEEENTDFLVLEHKTDEDGQEYLEDIVDEDILAAVYEAYLKQTDN